MAAHAWENRSTTEGEEEDDDLDRWGVCSDPDDEDVEPESTPGMDFARMMLRLLFTGTLSAMTFCILMWYAGRAGIAEAVPYGKAPGGKTGHYSRKVKSILGWKCVLNSRFATASRSSVSSMLARSAAARVRYNFWSVPVQATSDPQRGYTHRGRQSHAWWGVLRYRGF